MPDLKATFRILILLLTINFVQTIAQTTLPALGGEAAKVKDLTERQLQEILTKAQERGLSEYELEKLAYANGYTTDDIAKVRERAYKAKSGIEKERNTQKEVAKGKGVREQTGELSERVSESSGDSTLKKEENKFEVFGYELFNNKNLKFEANLNIPTPVDYVLGSGDELGLDISGYAYQHYDLIVSPEGTVRIESLSPIQVGGLTVDRAKEKIGQRLRVYFAGLRNGSLNLDLTLSGVRSIKVTVVGEVANPGSYTVSSLSTVFNALYLSAGPNEVGSFRNIQVIRKNRVIQRLDLYDFLLKGQMKGNINLHDQDVIFVPVADKKVRIEGEVRRPMIYELLGTESLQEGIGFAGNFTEDAFRKDVTVIRSTDKEKEILTVSQMQFKSFGLRNGDILKVGALLERFENRVEIMGAVYRPGGFSISSNLHTLSQLIKRAEGLRKDAYLQRGIIYRQKENLDLEIISINLEDVLSGSDIELKPEDLIVVKSIIELREERKITILGAINKPGVYDFADSLSVEDLIILANGFTEGASPKRIEVSRRLKNDETNNQAVEIIYLDVIESTRLQGQEYILHPFDEVYIRELPNYKKQDLVRVEGEVYYPGVYAIKNRNERISDLIGRSGGVRKEGYLKGAKFYRKEKQVAVDLELVAKNNQSEINLFLENGDRLYIPKEEQIVKLSGEVLNKTMVAYRPKWKFKDYIAQAGGFSDSAFVRKTYVKYANGLTNRTHSFLGIKKYPKVEKGMEVIVPTKRRNRLSKGEIITLTTALISLSAVLLTLIRSL